MSCGPHCPNKTCGEPYELTQQELLENVLFPKTFICPSCMEIWTLDIEQMEIVLQNARAFWGFDKDKGSNRPSETPEDWARLRQRWDNGEEI